MATLTQIHTRLVEFVNAIPGINTALKDYPLSRVFNDPMPAAIIEVTNAPARRETAGSGLYFVIRRFRIFLAVAVAENNTTAPNATQLALCETLIETVAKAFARSPRLACSWVTTADPPVTVRRKDLVYDTSLVTDEGIASYELDRLRVWGTVFTIDVTNEVNYQE